MTGHEPEFDLIWLREARETPGKPAPLSREQIVQAATELAQEGGIDAVSIRRIAARLGVGATSLYWHVRSKNGRASLPSSGSSGWMTTSPRHARPIRRWRVTSSRGCT